MDKPTLMPPQIQTLLTANDPAYATKSATRSTAAVDSVARNISVGFADGTSPILRTWSTSAPEPPFNPASNAQYKGFNFLSLVALNQQDPRWMTYKQVSDSGLQLNKGAKASAIVYWQTRQAGKPLPRPRLFKAQLFNGSDIRGLPVDRPQSLNGDAQAGLNALANRQSLELNSAQAISGYFKHLVIQDVQQSQLITRAGLRGPEDLLTHITLFMLASRLRLPYAVAQTQASSAAAWARAIDADPLTLMRVSTQADRIADNLYARIVASVRSPDTPAQAPTLTPTPTQAAIPSPFTHQTSKRDQLQSEVTAMPPPETRPTTDIDIRAQFAEFLRSLSLVVDPAAGHPIMDGKKHRIPVLRADGKQAKNTHGMYIGFLDGWPAGFGKNHVTGEARNWKANIKVDPAAQARIRAEAAANATARADALEQQYNHQAKRSQQYLALLPLANADHPYLLDKRLTPDSDLRQNKKGELILGLRDGQGQVRTFQRIGSNGFKGLKKNAQTSGNFYLIDPERKAAQSDLVLVVEGYATGRTLNALTKLPVVVTINAHNLKAGAREAKRAFPSALFVIAGDDDRHLEAAGPAHNVGKVRATEAAAAVGGRVMLPEFGARAGSRDSSDWNDLERIVGRSEVLKQLRAAIRPARQELARTQSNALTQARGRGR